MTAHHFDADTVRETAGEPGAVAVLRGLGVDTDAGHRRDENLDGLRLPAAVGEDRNASFSVHLKDWVCKDFGGHFEGSLYQLVQEANGCDFPEAVAWVADVCGLRNGHGPKVPAQRTPRRRAEPPRDFWTAERKARQRAAQQALTPDHPLAGIAAERDQIDYATLKAFGCGIWEEHGREWLAFPFPTGCQLYRRENGEKVLLSVKGSKPGESFFGETRAADGDAIWIAKSPREAMLLSQWIEAADVIGLPGGESPKLSEAQAETLRGHPRKSIRVVMDCDTPKAAKTARAFAEAVAEAVDVPVGLVDVSAVTEYKDVTDVLLAGGDLAIALSETEAIHPARVQKVQEVHSAPAPNWIPFPIEDLPAAVADYVRGQAAALDCDEALVALPAIGALAAAVGNSYRVQIKHSWEEPSALWLMPVNSSGSKKSPALQAGVEPILSLQREANEHFDYERTEYESLTMEEKKSTPEPQRQRYRVGDTTTETVGLLHGQNPRGLVVIRDEGGGWIGNFNRYARGEADQQVWIEMHGGRPVAIDRKSSDVPAIFIERPHVCVVATIQFGILRDLLTPSLLSGGFAARLLLAAPPERPRKWTDADVTPSISAAYHGLVRALYRLPDGAQLLRLSSEAKALFIGWVNENGAVMDATEDGPMKAALSKIEAVAARLALTFHLADTAEAEPGEVSGDAMRRGISIARWFRHETARLYALLGIEDAAKNRDQRLAKELPEMFGWEKVAELWQVKRRAAFDTIKRLLDASLITQEGHGQYRRCTVHSLHSLHFAPEGGTREAPLVQKVQEVRSAVTNHA